MRKRWMALITPILVTALLVPAGAWARRIEAAGGIFIDKCASISGTTCVTPGALTNELVVTAVMANPGLEKTITQQLPLPGPLYVLPFIVDEDKDNPKPGDFDTILGLTNTTNATLNIRLTVRKTDGTTLATILRTLNPFATIEILLSDALSGV